MKLTEGQLYGDDKSVSDLSHIVQEGVFGGRYPIVGKVECVCAIFVDGCVLVGRGSASDDGIGEKNKS